MSKKGLDSIGVQLGSTQRFRLNIKSKKLYDLLCLDHLAFYKKS